MRKKMKMIFALGLMLACTGCAGQKTDSYEAGDYDTGYVDEVQEGYTGQEAGEGLSESYASYDAEDSDMLVYDYDMYDMEGTESEAEAAETNTADTVNTAAGIADTLNREMLVYRGTISIDTLDFEKSVSDFKVLLEEQGGFVESETYSDNYSTSGYYAIDEEDKQNLYSATVRVPSTQYNTLMDGATGLGDVRSRSSNASNVTQQYSTYTSQLEIYEAEYNRYLSLLEQATEDEYALQIENELFDIQIQIATLKSSITNIENDVAYSYIDITIKEVTEYEEEPASTDTFLDRLKITCRDSWKGFLAFVEGIVFCVIMNIYYIVILLVIIFVIWRWIKKRKKAKKSRQQEGTSEKTEDTADGN